jgi:hypothetical protein
MINLKGGGPALYSNSFQEMVMSLGFVYQQDAIIHKMATEYLTISSFKHIALGTSDAEESDENNSSSHIYPEGQSVNNNANDANTAEVAISPEGQSVNNNANDEMHDDQGDKVKSRGEDNNDETVPEESKKHCTSFDARVSVTWRQN